MTVHRAKQTKAAKAKKKNVEKASRQRHADDGQAARRVANNAS